MVDRAVDLCALTKDEVLAYPASPKQTALREYKK